MITTVPAILRRATTDRIGNMLRADTVRDAGMYGGPANLPMDPGPIDPPILTGGGNNNYGPAPGPTALWTRMDPNMGYINPSIEVSGGGPDNNNPVYGSDQNTGGNNPVYVDTGTTGNTDTGPNATPSYQPPPTGGLLWFQPGYQPPVGIQNAIARGDYERAYGPSANSLAALNIMASQAYGGAPNLPQPDDFGEFGPGRQIGFSRGLRGAPSVDTNAASVAAFNNWVMAHQGGG